MKQHNEKLEALENLDTLEELHNDPNTRFRLGCRFGTKSVSGTCVAQETPVTVELHHNVSQALNKVRNRLLNRQGAK